MPKEKDEKSLCMSGLRHAEYYGMQETFDELYAKGKENKETKKEKSSFHKYHPSLIRTFLMFFYLI